MSGVCRREQGREWHQIPRPLPRDHWSRLAHGDVAEDGAVIKMDIVEVKASDGSFVCGDSL